MSNKNLQDMLCECIVIFGASGDLSFRKLMPSFYDLFGLKQLPPDFVILGVGRSDYTDESFRLSLVKPLKEHSRLKHDCSDDFLSHVHYLSLNTSDAQEYLKLKHWLTKLNEKRERAAGVLYYLATPPSLCDVIPECLAANDLHNQGTGLKRLVIEKPLGRGLESASQLDEPLHAHFDEKYIFRIDH